MQAYRATPSWRQKPFIAHQASKCSLRSPRCNSSQSEMHCVRIEHNADESITFSFSNKAGEVEQVPAIEQGLPIQPEEITVPGLACTRETVNATENTGSEIWSGTELAPSLQTLSREKALTYALVPARERQQYLSSGDPDSDSRHLNECLRTARPYSIPGSPGKNISPGKEEGDIEYASDEDVKFLERHWSADDTDDVTQFSGKNPPPLSEWRGSRRARFAAAVLDGMDETNEDSMSLLDKFSNLCHGGQLDAALVALSRFVVAERADVLRRLLQRHFLKKAAEQAAQAQNTKLCLPVRQAIKFMQILPRKYASLATYNMVLTVCVRSRDLAAARQVVDMLRSTGQKPDAIIYSSLITACAAVGDADAAFIVRDEMLSEGHPINLKAATSLINSCSRQILNAGPTHRRDQLVLLERADEVLQNFVREKKSKVDEALWNAFLTAAGRAAQMKRALQTLDSMGEKNMKKDAATYGALIDACVRNHDKKLALTTYRKALNAGFVANVFIYTSAMAACIPDKDKDTALQIFHESRRNGVKADDKMHAVLMAAVGSSDLSQAIKLKQELADKHIMRPQAPASSLIDAALRNDDLENAMSLLADSQMHRHKLSTNTVNSLLDTLARTGKVSQTCDTLMRLVQGGFVPDKYTYTALLTACSYADAGELAFTVWRLMEHHKISIDEPICFILLRTCFNQIKISHAPYEPGEESKAEAEEKLGLRLVEVLQGPQRLVHLSSQEKHLPWGARAMTVYRKLTSSGIKPQMHVLDRLVACFRLWALPEPSPSNPSYGAPLKLRAFLKADGRKATVPAHSLDGIYDDRAFSLLEEAVAEGLLPSLKPSKGALIIDLKKVPPATSEVYILEMLAHFLESDNQRKREKCRIIFKTQPSNEKKIKSNQNSESPQPSPTFLAIKALLGKLGFRFSANSGSGSIFISPERLVRWKRLVDRSASAWEESSMNSIQKAVRLRDSLHHQTMSIRLGMSKDEMNEPPSMRNRNSFNQFRP